MIQAAHAFQLLRPAVQCICSPGQSAHTPWLFGLAMHLQCLLGQFGFKFRSRENESTWCRCISTSNQRVVDVTVANLSAADAASLLDTAVDRLDRKIGQRQTLISWIKAVLLRHTAYLMSSGGTALRSLEQHTQQSVTITFLIAGKT